MTDAIIYEIAREVIKQAKNHGLTISTAESCTGGWVAKALTDIPGSSSVFMGSLVAYSNRVKEDLLGVPSQTLIQNGAVSEPTAIAMAKNCVQCFGTDIAVSLTGIAGPGGGSKKKPVGLVYMGVAREGETKAYKFIFEDNGRDFIRRAAVKKALELILEN